jgi:hypothetical protein
VKISSDLLRHFIFDTVFQMERAFSTALDEELRREDVSHSPACSLDPSDYRWGEDIDHHQKQALFKQFSAMAQNVAILFYSFFPSLPLSPGCPMPPWLMQASYGQMSMGELDRRDMNLIASRIIAWARSIAPLDA